MCTVQCDVFQRALQAGTRVCHRSIVQCRAICELNVLSNVHAHCKAANKVCHRGSVYVQHSATFRSIASWFVMFTALHCTACTHIAGLVIESVTALCNVVQYVN